MGSVWLRLVTTVGLLAVVVLQIDWGRAQGRLAHGDPLQFLAAIALVVTALGIGAYRWHRLLEAAGIRLRPQRLVRVYAISTFSNTFLPSAVGGDVARALLVVRRGPLLSRVATTVVVDRLAGLIGLLGVAWICVLVQPGAVPDGPVAFLAAVSVAVVGCTAAAGFALARGSRRIRRRLPRRFVSAASHVRAVVVACLQDRGLLAWLLVTSLAFQACVAAETVLLARAIDVELSFATAAVAVALVTMATLIPISIAGFGVREASFVVLLGQASVAATDAALISLLTVVAVFAASLPGAVLLARRGIEPALDPLAA